MRIQCLNAFPPSWSPPKLFTTGAILPASTFGSFTIAVSAAICAFNSVTSFASIVFLVSSNVSVSSLMVCICIAETGCASSGIAITFPLIVIASFCASAGVGVKLASAIHHVFTHAIFSDLYSRSTKWLTAPLLQPNAPFSASA